MLSGAVAAGKSLIGCYKGFLLNILYPGNRGLICRKEASSLKGSTIKTLLEQVIPTELIVSYNQMRQELVHKTRIPNVYSTIVFSGLDKKADQAYPTKIGSTEFGWIFVDEGIELEKGDWQMLSTRLRYRLKGYSNSDVVKIPKQMFTATNPDSPFHWLHKFFIDEIKTDREVIYSTPYDNPHLPDGYLNKLEGSLSGIARQRLLYGKWVQAEGVIYNCFFPDKHVINTGFLDIKDYNDVFVGADSNFPLPRSAVIIGYKKVDGKEVFDVLDEFYEKNCHVDKMICWVQEWQQKREQRIIVYHDPSDPASIDLINESNGLVGVKADNKVIPGISKVSNLFRNDQLRISGDCKNLIKELLSYRWALNKVGDVPLKVNDHLMDSLRYALNSFNSGEGTFTLLSGKGWF